MRLGRLSRVGLGVLGVLGFAVALTMALWKSPDPETRTKPTSTEGNSAETDATESETRVVLLSKGDSGALASVFNDLGIREPGAVNEEADTESSSDEVDLLSTPFDPEAFATYLDDLDGVRVGYRKFTPNDRLKFVRSIPVAMSRLTIAPAPLQWGDVFVPTIDLLTTALNDPSPMVRADATQVIGLLWNWYPGIPDGEELTPAGLDGIAFWKSRLHEVLVPKIRDPEPPVRLGTVKALGLLAIDGKAMPALIGLSDEAPAVRHQVLSSFAARPLLLTNEDVFPILFDSDETVALTAQLVLRTRGLSEDQINIAQLLYHPDPTERASVISTLKDRTDIDPIVWLNRLSNDADEEVRARALLELSKHQSPDALARIAAMAREDPSPAIRDTAIQLVGGGGQGAVPPPKIPVSDRSSDPSQIQGGAEEQ